MQQVFVSSDIVHRRFRFFAGACGPWRFWQKKISFMTRAFIPSATIYMATQNFRDFCSASNCLLAVRLSKFPCPPFDLQASIGPWAAVGILGFCLWPIRPGRFGGFISRIDSRSYSTYILGRSIRASRVSTENGNPNFVITPVWRAWKVVWRPCLSAVALNPCRIWWLGCEIRLLPCRYLPFEPPLHSETVS